MNEEKMKILKMVEEGQLGVDQRVPALEGGDRHARVPPVPRQPDQHGSADDDARQRLELGPRLGTCSRAGRREPAGPEAEST